LVLGPQVTSKTGLPRETPQRLAFKVRPAFVVKLTCQRANKDAACLPVTPIVLDFNAPVSRETAARVRLTTGRQTWEPTLEPNVKTVEAVEFKGPFPEKARFTVELPRDFRDDAGREPREQGGVSARHRHRREPAARQVSRALRDTGVECRAGAPGHRAQRRSDPEGTQGPAFRYR
jgi:hypothetical protein